MADSMKIHVRHYLETGRLVNVQPPRLHGDPRTTGRQETASQRRKRRRAESRGHVLRRNPIGTRSILERHMLEAHRAGRDISEAFRKVAEAMELSKEDMRRMAQAMYVPPGMKSAVEAAVTEETRRQLELKHAIDKEQDRIRYEGMTQEEREELARDRVRRSIWTEPVQMGPDIELNDYGVPVDEADPLTGEPTESAEELDPRDGRCNGTTKKGTRCKKKTDGLYCKIHAKEEA